MLDFTYYAPTKVYFGRDKENDVGKIISNYGYKTIMMQYGKDSIKRSGLFDRVMQSCAENGITIVEMGGVEPNPKVEFVREAVKLAKEKSVELILAVGGGSVLDSAKATAVGSATDTDIWEFSMRRAVPKAARPVGCILTHSAAGSEMSSSCVITNLKENMKRGFNSEFNRCKFAICNPELTYTVSKYQTACGIVDIMSHTMERYFTQCPPTDLTDRISECILKAVVSAGRVLMNNPRDYEVRATVMWASSLSHNDLTGCGRENALAVHQLEHALSGEYDFISHGAGLAVLFPAWARYVYKKAPSRFAQFARRVFDVTEEDDERAALAGIEAMEEFFKELEMPLKLRKFGIPVNCAERLADLCTYGKTRTVKNYIELDFDNIKMIFESCY